MKSSTPQRLVSERYANHFGGDFLVARAPGRINLIGEHTDYNDGFVLPAAIDKYVFVAAGRSNDKIIRLHAVDFNENFETGVEHLLPNDKGWTNYITGVADQLNKRGYKISGFNMAITGEVPPGSGMSSSAAIECSAVFALNALFKLSLSLKEMAEIAQLAEHTFAGVKSGIMDQFASLFGKKDHLIKLDCRDLSYEYEPLQLNGYKIVLLNTNVSHTLASSEYNERRHQCEEGVRRLQQFYPEVKSLRDVSLEMLSGHINKEDIIYRRCSYVIEENQRLQEACEFLEKGDITALGKKLYESHDGLSRKYEVSCRELDFLVDFVRRNKNVAGARMMGGGFGGCTINLIKEDQIDNLITDISAAYESEMNRQLTPYFTESADGASIIQGL